MKTQVEVLGMEQRNGRLWHVYLKWPRGPNALALFGNDEFDIMCALHKFIAPYNVELIREEVQSDVAST